MRKMIATNHGFYKGRYIRPGETFDFPKKERVRGWMTPAEGADKNGPGGESRAELLQKALSLGLRPHPSTGVERLKTAIADAEAKKTGDPSTMSEATAQTTGQMGDDPRDGLV